MKRTFGFLTVAVLATLLAKADEVAFVGQSIGTIPVSSDARGTMVAVAFKELSANASLSVSVSNILSTANLINGDKVLVYSQSGYSAWTLQDGYWQAIPKASVDSMGVVGMSAGTASDASRPDVCEGFWLLRTETVARPLSRPFYVCGAYVADASGTAQAGVKSLMGNPKSVAKTPIITGAHKGDTIGLVAGNGKLLNEYTFNGTGWTQLVAGSGGLPTLQAVTVTIPAGHGFWYNSTGTSSVSLVWE